MGVLFFLFGCAMCVGTALLASWGIPENASLLREIAQGTLVEAAGCLLMAGLFFGVLRKRFPSAKAYSAAMPHRDLIAGAVLICPLVCFLQMLLFFGEPEAWLWVEPDASWAEAGALLAELPLTAVFAPLMEELSTRVFCITQFSSKKGRLAAALAASLLFALMHASRWKPVLLSGCFYAALLLLSKNIWVSAVFHMAHNLSTILVPVWTELYLLAFPGTSWGVMGTPPAVIALLAALFGLGLWRLIRYFRAIKTGQAAG